MQKVKVAVVKPQSESGFFDWKLMRLMPLGGPTLVGYLKSMGFDAEFIDCDFEKLNFEKYDVVSVSMLTPEASAGYKIGDRCRELNIPAIAGGFHATFCPDETKKHFDIVVRGEGIPIIVDAIDMALKREQKILDGGACSAEKLNVVPDRSFLKNKNYTSPNSIITSFGCPYKCDFCTVWAMNKGGMFFKPKETVEKEVEGFVKGKPVFIPDDNMGFVKDYVFDILRKHNFRFMGEADIDFVKSKKFGLAVKSGLVGLALGFESLDDKVLSSLNKRNKKQSARGYEKIIKKCKDNGLLVYGFFLIDPDNQTFDDIKNTVKWAIEQNLDFAQFPILTPYPGTTLREKVKDRIITNNWSKYNTINAVFSGLKMDPAETENACAYAHRTFYSWKSVFKRLLHTKNLPVFAYGNIGAINASGKIWKQY